MRIGLVGLCLAMTACGPDYSTLPAVEVTVVETPVALDAVTGFGFTAEEVLAWAEPGTYAAALGPDDASSFGPDSLSDDLLAHGPFAVGALESPVAVVRSETVDGEPLASMLWIRGTVAVTSADGALATSGPMILSATGLSDAGIAWTWEAGGGTAGQVPGWAEAELADQMATHCPELGASAGHVVVGAVGRLDGLRLLLNVQASADDCGYSANVAALTLDRMP